MLGLVTNNEIEKVQKETVWPDLKYDFGIETKTLRKTAKHFGIASLRGEF
jgi:hypothetical protein